MRSLVWMGIRERARDIVEILTVKDDKKVHLQFFFGTKAFQDFMAQG
jgi:hypothetical protein